MALKLTFGRGWRRMAILLTLALPAFAVSLGSSAAAASPPATVDGVACAQAEGLGLYKQMNLRASYILYQCGLAGPAPATRSSGGGRLGPLAPPNVWVSTELDGNVKSESMVWSSDGTTIVVSYNDGTDFPGNVAGISYSIDGGATFTRIRPSPLAIGHGSNFGDPIVAYNARLTTWFAGDLVSGCGGQGIGLWTSPAGVNWAAGACAHSGANDDRESMWVDNNPASPWFGRMYISWNDFSLGARIFVTSSDDGITWSAPVVLSDAFERNLQMTGAPDTGSVFVAAMNEGGGGFNLRTNIFYRSIDGGTTFTRSVANTFQPPGDIVCPINPYFVNVQPIWRHMGWGQPGAGPGGVIHYAYAGLGVNPGDTGDIYYIQSIDNGDTWSVPIVLNSDQAAGGTATQWMPSLSVNAGGKVQVGWYDRRNTTDSQNYEYFGVQSLDNGVTWQPDAAISDQLIPQPAPPFFNACYAGDYNYHSAFGTTSYTTWTDGRISFGGSQIQNVFFAAVP
jgi:hypothetical protein